MTNFLNDEQQVVSANMPNQISHVNPLNQAFIETYKKIEAFANQKFNHTGKYMPMSQLTDNILSQLPGAQTYATDFELFNNLRNMMQHKASDQYFTIQPQVVTLIQHVHDVLTKPISVGELFQSEVIFIRETASYETLIELIRRHHYTQFPVIQKGQVLQNKVITANALAHALTLGQQPNVKEILAQSKAMVKVIPAQASIFTAEKLLLDAVKKGHKSVVLLIVKKESQKHLRPEDVVGLINLADLSQILSKK